METATNVTHLSEEIVTEILARLTLRSISRFKTVCKRWKTAIESVYFRRLFVSLHQNTSSSWSLICAGFKGKELMGFDGCETWGLPKSLASYIPRFFDDLPTRSMGMMASSNGLVWMEVTGYGSFVGNPLLQQWLEIPSSPYGYGTMFGLVTRLDEDRVVLSFKLVKRLEASLTCLKLHIYSSETGIWTCKQLHCPYHIGYHSPMSLNGTLYLLFQILDFEFFDPGVLLAHDFYSESNEFRVIPLPDPSDQKYKRALSTSGGYVTYIKTLGRDVVNVLKVWRLNNDDSWQLLWQIRLTFIPWSVMAYHAPLAMHPFDSDIVYIWCQQNRYLVACNLRTQNYRILGDDDNHQDCFLNESIIGGYMDLRHRSWVYGNAVALFQFVLPRWMESVPCPPQLEIIDTTALHSYIDSIHKSKRDKGEEFSRIQ